MAWGSPNLWRRFLDPSSCSGPCPTGWRLEVLEPPRDTAVQVGSQAHFNCTLSEVVLVGEATWYINGVAVQLDDADWTVTADGSHHTLLLRCARPHHTGEVTFAARDAVVSARLTVLGGWLALLVLLGCWTCRWVGRVGRFQPQKLLGALRVPPPRVDCTHSLFVTETHDPHFLRQSPNTAAHRLGGGLPAPSLCPRIRHQGPRGGAPGGQTQGAALTAPPNHAGLPDPPEDAEVVGRSNRSVTLSWVAPTSDGGGGLCGYRVEMKASATGEWQLCHKLVPGPECIVDGLAPGETYRFRVAAVGPAGAGEPVHLPQMVRLGELLPWSQRVRIGVQPEALRPPHAGDGVGQCKSLLTCSLAADPLEPPPAPPAPESRQVVAGEDLCLECEVAEAGEVVWLKDSEHIQLGGRFQAFSHGWRQTLVIHGFSAEDQGEYHCRPARDPISAAAIAFQGVSSKPRVWGWESGGNPGVWGWG